jgi:hypothetical protein
MASSSERRVVAIKIDGVVSVHAVGDNGNYDTLCGIDANDSSVGHEGVVRLPWVRARIGCEACKSILKQAWKYTSKDITH